MTLKETDAKKIITEKRFNNDFEPRYLTIEQDHELIRQVIVARKKIGLTQKSLADKIGVSQQEISRFENEKHIPKLSNFLRIIDAVGLEIKLESKHSNK